MFSGDEKTFAFVRNQLMRMLGVKKQKKKKGEKKRFGSTTKTEILMHRSVVKTKKESFIKAGSNASMRSPSPDIDGDTASQFSFKKKQVHSNQTSPIAKNEM